MNCSKLWGVSVLMWALTACGGGTIEPSPNSLALLEQAASASSLAPASRLLQPMSAAQGTTKPARLSQASTRRAPSAGAFFDWAERTYSELFPGPQLDRSLPPYVYRYYPGTYTYLAVSGDQIYALGPLTGGRVVSLGGLADFACLVSPASCAPPADFRPYILSLLAGVYPGRGGTALTWPKVACEATVTSTTVSTGGVTFPMTSSHNQLDLLRTDDLVNLMHGNGPADDMYPGMTAAVLWSSVAGDFKSLIFQTTSAVSDIHGCASDVQESVGKLTTVPNLGREIVNLFQGDHGSFPAKACAFNAFSSSMTFNEAPRAITFSMGSLILGDVAYDLAGTGNGHVTVRTHGSLENQDLIFSTSNGPSSITLTFDHKVGLTGLLHFVGDNLVASCSR